MVQTTGVAAQALAVEPAPKGGSKGAEESGFADVFKERKDALAPASTQEKTEAGNAASAETDKQALEKPEDGGEAVNKTVADEGAVASAADTDEQASESPERVGQTVPARSGIETALNTAKEGRAVDPLTAGETPVRPDAEPATALATEESGNTEATSGKELPESVVGETVAVASEAGEATVPVADVLDTQADARPLGNGGTGTDTPVAVAAPPDGEPAAEITLAAAAAQTNNRKEAAVVAPANGGEEKAAAAASSGVFGKNVSDLAKRTTGESLAEGEPRTQLGKTISALAPGKTVAAEGKGSEAPAGEKGGERFLESIRTAGNQLREVAPEGKAKGELDDILRNLQVPGGRDTSGAQTVVAPAGASQAPGTASGTTNVATQSFNLNVPVQQRGWDQGLGERVVWMVKEGVQDAQIQLNPRNLGPVEIRISMHQDQASVTFAAHNPQTREALEAAMPRLREMMNEQGLDLAKSEVSQQSPHRGRDGREGMGESGQRGFDGQQADAGELDEDMAQGVITPVPSGSLDYYA